MHETPKKSIQNANKTSSSSHLDPGIYQICKVRYESPEDIKTVIGLTVEIGKAANGGSTKFVPISIIPTAMIVKKKLDSWAAKHFFCKRYMPKPEKIGWDATKNFEIHAEQSKKK